MGALTSQAEIGVWVKAWGVCEDPGGRAPPASENFEIVYAILHSGILAGK